MTINDDCARIARQIMLEILSETMPEIVHNIVPEIHFETIIVNEKTTFI